MFNATSATPEALMNTQTINVRVGPSGASWRLTSYFNVTAVSYEDSLKAVLTGAFGPSAPTVSQADSITAVGRALRAINREVVR
jgi:hypothetical protein